MARFVACVMCRAPLEGKSSKRTFCSSACRQRAYRRRTAGLPETFMSKGAAPEGSTSLLAQRERTRRVIELAEMGVELKHDRVMFLLHH